MTKTMSMKARLMMAVLTLALALLMASVDSDHAYAKPEVSGGTNEHRGLTGGLGLAPGGAFGASNSGGGSRAGGGNGVTFAGGFLAGGGGPNVWSRDKTYQCQRAAQYMDWAKDAQEAEREARQREEELRREGDVGHAARLSS